MGEPMHSATGSADSTAPPPPLSTTSTATSTPAPTPPLPPQPSPPLAKASVPVVSFAQASQPPSAAVKSNGLAAPTPAADGPRRRSIQFSLHQAESLLRSDSPRLNTPGSSRVGFAGSGNERHSRERPKRRLSSPPPPSSTFSPRVSFDTFDNRDASEYTFSLKSKHPDYVYSRRSRTFLCGTDQNDYSEFALEWLLDELVEDGDEVVCLRVVDSNSKMSSEKSIEEGRYRVEANKLFQQIQEKAKEDNGKKLSLSLEFASGKVHETFQKMINIYEPSCLIVGTRGKSLGGIQGLLPGSVSKYCLQNSPVPVIVVRPSAKREKKMRKRRADPARRAYLDIFEASAAAGVGLTGRPPAGSDGSDSRDGALLASGQAEAEAVARAIGIPSVFAASRTLRGGKGMSSFGRKGSGVGRKSSLSNSPILTAADIEDISAGEQDGEDGAATEPLTKVASNTTSNPETPSPSPGEVLKDPIDAVGAAIAANKKKSPPPLATDGDDDEDEGDDEDEEDEEGSPELKEAAASPELGGEKEDYDDDLAGKSKSIE